MSAAESYARTGVIRFNPDPICNGYHIHYNYDGWRLCFDVYPIYDWTGPNNTSGISYVDKENEPDTLEVFEEGKCLMKLQGSYCWRGVWEGRLYFPDSEYWDSELPELSKLWTEFIEPWARDFIQKVEGKTYHE